MTAYAAAGTLTISTVDTVTLDRLAQHLSVISRDGTSEIWFTIDGSAPTVAGANCYYAGPAASSVIDIGSSAAGTVTVKLISSAAATFAVQVA